MERLIEKSKAMQNQIHLEALQHEEANEVVNSVLPLKIESRLKIESLKTLSYETGKDYTHQMNLIKEGVR